MAGSPVGPPRMRAAASPCATPGRAAHAPSFARRRRRRAPPTGAAGSSPRLEELLEAKPTAEATPSARRRLRPRSRAAGRGWRGAGAASGSGMARGGGAGGKGAERRACDVMRRV